MVIFSSAGQLCSGHSLTASGGNLHGVRGGKSSGPCVSRHLSKLDCACSDDDDRVSSGKVKMCEASCTFKADWRKVGFAIFYSPNQVRRQPLCKKR